MPGARTRRTAHQEHSVPELAGTDEGSGQHRSEPLGKAMSITAAIMLVANIGNEAIRPANQRIASASKLDPAMAVAPVQLGTAVSRNPAIAAATKPNSIS